MPTAQYHALVTFYNPNRQTYPPPNYRNLSDDPPDPQPPDYRTAMASQIPIRSNTGLSDEDAIPDGDPSETTKLFQERLQAWKHMCGNLESYIGELAKNEKSQAKENDKILKILSSPLKEAHQFDQNVGGVSGLFENIRVNTQAQSNLHLETHKNLIGTVLPILERLHAEIKNKSKELNSGAGKGTKAVDKARITTQKHLEALGQHTASFNSAGSNVSAANDPYVLHRGVYHRLNKQVLEENSSRQDMLAVQSSFQQFEAQVLTSVQAALSSLQQFMCSQADQQKAMFTDVTSTAQKIPMDFEWNGFVKRNEDTLVNPNAAPRSMNNITFPNQDHRATRPLIEGTLERKSRGIGALKGYSSGYYAVTPAGYLHEFKSDDNYAKDPTPEISLYLPDCTVGVVDANKFSIKGKDSSGGKVGQKLAMSSDFNFKAYTVADAEQWHSIIVAHAGASSTSAPVSPVESRNVSGVQQPGPIDTTQQQGLVAKESAPTSAVQQSPEPVRAVPQVPQQQQALSPIPEKQPAPVAAATIQPRPVAAPAVQSQQPRAIDTTSQPLQRIVSGKSVTPTSARPRSATSEKLMSPYAGETVKPSGAGSHFGGKN